MAFGIGSPGKSPEMHVGEVRMRTLAEYREHIRQITRQGLVDIMLMSTSSNDALTIGEGLFENSHVTPAARANDTSDIFAVRHGRYIAEPSRPFRTASIDHIQCGHVDCDPAERGRGADLGLYSVTFNNRLDEDMASLADYRRFREEAERKGFRHFLEVFDPNAPRGFRPTARRSSSTTRSPAPRWRCDRRPAGVPEDRLSRPAGDGGVGLVRPAPDRGHPGRRSRHDVRRVQTDRRGPEVRRACGAVRPQDQQRRIATRLRRVPASHRRWRSIARGGGAGLSRRATTTEDQTVCGR